MPILDENANEDEVIEYLESIIKNIELASSSSSSSTATQIVIPSSHTETTKKDIIKNIKQTIRLFDEMKKNPQLAGVASHPAVSPVGSYSAVTSSSLSSKNSVALGKEVDDAAIVIRMYYLKQMKEMQTQINNILAMLQEHTANPKTDSSLGKVGV
jgi:YesN/AraC family two-component response regulator